jgi:hypothetical protein
MSIAVSFILIYVDDILHAFGGKDGGRGIRDRLHRNLIKFGIPPLTIHSLTMKESVSFLGMNIMYLPDRRIYVSQPGHADAIVNNFPTKAVNGIKPKSCPLPANFSTRKLVANDEKLLAPEDTSLYNKWLQTIAWLNKTRIDLCAAVAYKQKRCSNPRRIDWLDLEHMVGYLKGSVSRGVVKAPDDTSSVIIAIDAAWAIHERRENHSGCLTFIGNLTLAAVLWKSWIQRVVAPSSTNAELIADSDMLDNGFLVHSYLSFLRKGVNPTITVLQDNTSTITIAYLGRPSAQARRRYIGIRYFW